MFYEEDELKRTIRELNLVTPYEELERKFEKAPQVTLPDSIWKKLENTDYDVETPRDVKAKLVEYDRDPTNYDSVNQEMKSGNWFPPLIMQLKNGTFYLVAGNTRLMVCKVNSITPRVKMIVGVE